MQSQTQSFVMVSFSSPEKPKPSKPQTGSSVIRAGASSHGPAVLQYRKPPSYGLLDHCASTLHSPHPTRLESETLPASHIPLSYHYPPSIPMPRLFAKPMHYHQYYMGWRTPEAPGWFFPDFWLALEVLRTGVRSEDLKFRPKHLFDAFILWSLTEDSRSTGIEIGPFGLPRISPSPSDAVGPARRRDHIEKILCLSLVTKDPECRMDVCMSGNSGVFGRR
ncbi:hypothetical protein BXZ70DRAFT_1045277 [Cristinia sonorae]|uniref:Uncharacterized protein n=1 Tax=Cristinia sonorae TaxID=1940300 RepID=A0A8K0UGD8_9AGAR|nr:hypothetical protein BXZ70DRAFT_1045277 [Cristinia sonorae]